VVARPAGAETTGAAVADPGTAEGELWRHRLGDRRHRPVDDFRLGVGVIGVGLFWLVLATVLMLVVLDKDGGDIVALVFWGNLLEWGPSGLTGSHGRSGSGPSRAGR
jgi:hypothetical protein